MAKVKPIKFILFANTDWYLYNFRLSLAKKLRDLDVDVLLVSPPGRYAERIQEKGFRWVSFPMKRRSLNPISEIITLIRLFFFYKRERPDMVHHFTIKPVLYGSFVARILGIKKKINTITGLGHIFIDSGFKVRILRAIVLLLYKLGLKGGSTKVIFQNPDDYEDFLRFGLIRPEQCKIIAGSGVDITQYKSNFTNDSANGFKVLLATRLLREKGVLEYVEAAKKLKGHNGNTQFLIAGSPDQGNPSTVSMERVMKWERDGIIRYLGQIENMSSLLQNVGLVVLPSYREGLPRILVEAAAFGLPIVTTDVPGCREVVENGINGILVPSRDADSLACAIKSLTDDHEKRLRMGVAGRDKVLKEYDENIIIMQTMRVYGELSDNKLFDKRTNHFETAAM